MCKDNDSMILKTVIEVKPILLPEGAKLVSARSHDGCDNLDLDMLPTISLRHQTAQYLLTRH